MTDHPSLSEALRDGPNVHKPGGLAFSSWTVLTAADADGVQHWFHVPTASLAARSSEPPASPAPASPDEPSRGGIRVLPPSRLADAEALLEQALYLPSMYTDDARAVIEAISTFLSEREVRAASAPASPDEPSIPTTTAGLELYERLDRNEIRKGGMPQRWRDLIVAIEREARAASASVPPGPKLSEALSRLTRDADRVQIRRDQAKEFDWKRLADSIDYARDALFHNIAAETPEQGRGDE